MGFNNIIEHVAMSLSNFKLVYCFKGSGRMVNTDIFDRFMSIASLPSYCHSRELRGRGGGGGGGGCVVSLSFRRAHIWPCRQELAWII